MWLVDAVCERAVRLYDGRVVDDADASTAIRRYLSPHIDDVAEQERPSARVERFEVRPPRIDPWQQVELHVTLDVDEAVAERARVGGGIPSAWPPAAAVVASRE
jgi:hypothetical protein